LPGQIIDDVLRIIGDGSASVVVDNGDNIAMDRIGYKPSAVL
jgi:hypothetical protein